MAPPWCEGMRNALHGLGSLNAWSPRWCYLGGLGSALLLEEANPWELHWELNLTPLPVFSLCLGFALRDVGAQLPAARPHFQGGPPYPPESQAKINSSSVLNVVLYNSGRNITNRHGDTHGEIADKWPVHEGPDLTEMARPHSANIITVKTTSQGKAFILQCYSHS